MDNGPRVVSSINPSLYYMKLMQNLLSVTVGICIKRVYWQSAIWNKGFYWRGVSWKTCLHKPWWIYLMFILIDRPHDTHLCWLIIVSLSPTTWPHFYQTRSAWSMDQGSNENHSPINSSTPTVIKFCVMWEGQALPHDTKFGNCRDNIEDSRAFLSWSLIQGSSWSGLIKVGPGVLFAKMYWL